MNGPFSRLANGVAISASTTSANAALPAPSPLREYVVRVVNGSSAIAYIAFGTSGSVTAVNTDIAVAPNSAAHIQVNTAAGITHVAALLSAGTGTVHAQAVA